MLTYNLLQFSEIIHENYACTHLPLKKVLQVKLSDCKPEKVQTTLVLQ